MATKIHGRRAKRQYGNFYGTSPNAPWHKRADGTKYQITHTGDFVLYDTRGVARVETYCGTQLLDYHDGDIPFNSKARELCKTCFRTFAWEQMVSRFEALASLAAR